jgi:nucleotide-binding universal stress UspA family protein
MSGALRYRRLVLELFLNAADRRIVRSAAEFAALFGFDLTGVFVEDEGLLGLARLPFARELRLPTYQWASLSSEQLALELQHAAEEARRELDKVAEAFGVSVSFERVRGDPISAILEQIGPSDVLVIAQPTTPPRHLVRPFARLGQAAFRSRAGLMFLPLEVSSKKGPVGVLIRDPSDPNLELAARLALALDEDLLVLMPESGGPADQPAILERLSHFGIKAEKVRIFSLPHVSEANLLHVLTENSARLLTLSREMTGGDNFAFVQAVAASGTAVLVVEPQEGSSEVR